MTIDHRRKLSNKFARSYKTCSELAGGWWTRRHHVSQRYINTIVVPHVGENSNYGYVRREIEAPLKMMSLSHV